MDYFKNAIVDIREAQAPRHYSAHLHKRRACVLPDLGRLGQPLLELTGWVSSRHDLCMRLVLFLRSPRNIADGPRSAVCLKISTCCIPTLY